MFIKSLTAVISIISLVAIVIYSTLSITDNINGSCIPIQPLGEVKGRIYYDDIPSATIRTKVRDRYFLYYPGVFDHSGKECESPVQVTQEEYNRQMERIDEQE